MALDLIVILKNKLECGPCADVIIKLEDPTKLAINDGVVDPLLLQSFLRAEVTGFTIVADPEGCRFYQYTFSYDEALLLDPEDRIEECDVIKICCADCVIEYVDERFIDESTVSSLVDHGDGTFTHDNGLGGLTVFNALSPLVDNADGTFTHTDEAGVVTAFNALGSVVDNLNNTFTYTDQVAAATIIDFGYTLTEPVPNLIRLTKPDGTQDDVSAAGVITTLVDNVDNTYTYTSEDTTVTVVNTEHTLTEPVPNTVRLTKPDGTFDEVVVGAGASRPLEIVRNIAEAETSPATTLNFNLKTAPLADSAVDFATWHITVPQDWDTAQDPTVWVRGYNTDGTAGDYRFLILGGYVAVGESVATGFPDVIAFTETAPGSLLLTETTPQSLTAANIAAGDMLVLLFIRLGTDVLDTKAGNFDLLDLHISFPRNNTGVTT